MDTIASTIEKKSNEALAQKNTVKKADISALLAEGATYPAGTLLDVPKYKKGEENLWLKAECQGDIKKHTGEFLKRDGEYLVIGKGKCECEERVRAFMRMLRDEEGVTGEVGYETLCGGESFIKNYGKNWDDHPQIKIYIKRINDYSSAAGAYQVMGYTWDSMASSREIYGITSFNPENQDRFAVVLLKHKRVGRLPESVIKKHGEKFRDAYGDMIKMILAKDFDKLFLTASLEWASFPDSPYGQQRADYTRKDVKVKYDAYLNEELKGKSDLHIKKGFLKEFGYSCNCQGEDNKPTKQGYDIDKAVSYIESHALAKSNAACASYVRLAIEAGGLKSNTQPRNALNYFGILKELGFTELQTTTYLKGDIVVFDAVTGHQYGHIAMWTGTEWISDFKQKSIIVNNAYNN